MRNFALLSESCAPRIWAAYFRIVWNGGATFRRLRTATCSKRERRDCCVLGCDAGEDSLEHYSYCPIFLDFACKDVSQGLGIPRFFRDRESFFLVRKDMDVRMKIRLAWGLYALQRTVIHLTGLRTREDWNVHKLLCRWAKRGAEGSSVRFRKYCASCSNAQVAWLHQISVFTGPAAD